MPDEITSTIETKEELTKELLPPEGDEKVGHRGFEILGEVLKDKAALGLPPRWQRNYELRRNKHFRQQTKKVPLITANLIFTHHQRTVNMLTDNNPTFNVARIGQEEGKEDIYQKLQKTTEYWWQDQEQQDVLEESVNAGEDNGITIEKVVFNPDLEFGMGEVETIVVDPHHFGWYPVKCKDIQKAEAVLHFWPMSVREARRRWPDHAEKIRADKELLEELGDSRREVQANSGTGIGSYFARIGNVVKSILSSAGSTSSGDEEECLILEMWVKDFTMVEVPDGRRKVPVQKPKYPGFIRYVTMCNSGKTVLEDRPNPSINPNLPDEQTRNTYLYDKFPFSKTVSLKDPVNPWGYSDKEQLEQLVTEVDITISQLSLFRNRAARLKIINPKDSGVANSQFSNEPGIINPNSSLVANAIRYMDPPAPPIDLQNTLQTYKDLFFLVAGSFELELAQAPGRDVIAYKAIAALLERATTMLKGKIRNYSKMVRERGRMYLSHVMNWYTEERWITYEEAGEEVSDTITGTELTIPAKLTVVSGSTMPVSKVQEREEALELFKLQAIDHEALLRRIEWQDWKEVAKRMKGGQIAPFFDMLEEIGMPPEMVQIFNEMAIMTPKEFESALKKGEIPDFTTLLASLQQGEGNTGQGPPPPSLQELEAQKKQAEIEKRAAEIALIQEKINSEKVEQDIKREELRIKSEELKIKRAEAVIGMIPPKPESKGAEARKEA